jgi:hypothetical protein
MKTIMSAVGGIGSIGVSPLQPNETKTNVRTIVNFFADICYMKPFKKRLVQLRKDYPVNYQLADY